MNDLRLAVRTLLRAPAFAAVAILSLAIGIGANTAIFSALNGLLLRPLPARDAGELFTLYTSDFSGPPYGTSSWPDYEDFATAAADVTSGLAAYTLAPVSLTRGGETERAYVTLASGNYFDVLGVRPLAGRTFVAADARPGAPAVAVLAESLWRTRFGADPDVVGRTLTINGRPVEAIGVIPASFPGLLRGMASELWVPLPAAPAFSANDAPLEQRGNRSLFVFGRLAPGRTLDDVEHRLEAAARELHARHAAEWTDLGGRARRVSVLDEASSRIEPSARGPITAFLALLLVVVGLVLLVACANVASLLLARALGRRQEIAIRLALGAARARLLRQLLAEGLVLGVLAGALALIVARWTLDAVVAFRPPVPLPVALEFPIDATVLAFTALLSLATAGLFGLVPALQATRVAVLPALRGDARPRSTGRGLQSWLVAGQVALSVAMLVAAALFVRSLQHAQTLSPGFDADDIVAFSTDLSLAGFDESRGRRTIDELAQRLAAVPGVESVTFARMVPLTPDVGRRFVTPEGYQAREGEDLEVPFNAVGPAYFETLRVPVLRGRSFTPADRDGAPGVAIVSRSFAERYWPGQEALGRRLSASGSEGPFLTVVGVVADLPWWSLNDRALAAAYVPLLQDYRPAFSVHVRTTPGRRAAADIVDAVRRVERGLPVFDVEPLAARVGFATFPQRIAASLLGLLGVLALLLTTVGVYGIVAQSVVSRIREIGIRMALGAARADVLRTVTRRGLAVVGIGCAAGLALAVGIAGLARRFLLGIGPADPVSYLGVVLVLVSTAALAAWLPARRATSIDPVAALRYE